MKILNKTLIAFTALLFSSLSYASVFFTPEAVPKNLHV
jgi:hypothetical protein